MISLDMIRNFYPAALQGDNFNRQLLREYIELLTLDYLANTAHIRNLTFIGGTNLRLVKGIDRFSEDLDFDCKNLSSADFTRMTDDIVAFLGKSGLQVETRDRQNDRLSAFRRTIHFPELLFELNLSGHREARFAMKIECQDQGYTYAPQLTSVKGCGFYFKIPVPPDPILCSMKLAALLARAKGRDFYDVMFLMAQTTPDFDYLAYRSGVSNMTELKQSLLALLTRIDLKQKQRDVDHLLFNQHNSRRLLLFPDFVASLPS